MYEAELNIGTTLIRPGETRQLELAVARLYTDTEVCMPVQVHHGRQPGPVVFVSAAVHGDELNGIEIVRRLVQMRSLKVRKGTLILVPMVNVYGVLNQSRYLPDRRDLNRSFPGSSKGSLAARVADTFLAQIVRRCDYGIDLHTGALHRSNLPQIRANLDDEDTRCLAEVFGVPVLLNANLRDGSLRQAAVESDTRVLLYEAGQALRFDELSIRAGVHGVLNVLTSLGMIRRRSGSIKRRPFIANNSAWVRASGSGIVHSLKGLGDAVSKGDLLAEIGNPFGEVVSEVRAQRSGLIIGKQNIPLVQEGDALFHLAFFSERDERVARRVEALSEALMPDGEQFDT